MSAGQLWSTPEDLGRWASFLARGADGVLDTTTIEQMCFPQVMYYPDKWILAWGLGLMLVSDEGVVYAGHGGAMAGHLSGVYVNRETQIGAAAVTNSGTRGDMDMTAIRLAAKTGRSLARAGLGTAARGGPRGRSVRCSATGGPREQRFCSGGRAAR